MTPTDKYFEELDLPVGASPEQIKEAYRDLLQIWHPDRYVNNPRLKARAEERIVRINEAYQALCKTTAPESNVPIEPRPPQPQTSGGCVGLISAIFVVIGFLMVVRFFGWWTLVFFIPALIWGIFQIIHRIIRHSVVRDLKRGLQQQSPDD